MEAVRVLGRVANSGSTPQRVAVDGVPLPSKMARKPQITVAAAVFGYLVTQEFHREVMDGVGATGLSVVDLISDKACRGERSDELK